MIFVTRLNGKEFAINSDLIETLEATPDTVITLTNQNKYVVMEPVNEVVKRITNFRKSIYPDFRGGSLDR